MLTSEQIRAARALLRMEQVQLAADSKVSIETVRRFEGVEGQVKGRDDTIQAVKTALEDRGIIFIEDDGKNGVGVRLDKRHTAQAKALKKVSDTELGKRIRELEDEMRRRGLTVEVEAAYLADKDGNVTVTTPKGAKGK